MPRMLLGIAQRFQAEVTFRSIKAIRDFERSSNRVAVVMIALVIAQIVLAVMLACITRK